jgi:hypothetical protein
MQFSVSVSASVSASASVSLLRVDRSSRPQRQRHERKRADVSSSIPFHSRLLPFAQIARATFDWWTNV